MGPRPHPEDSDRSLLRKEAPAQKSTVGYFSRSPPISRAREFGQRATGAWQIGAYTGGAGARWGESKLTGSTTSPVQRILSVHLSERTRLRRSRPLGFPHLGADIGIPGSPNSSQVGPYKNASRARWSQGNLTEWARAPIQRILTVHFSERRRLRKSRPLGISFSGHVCADASFPASERSDPAGRGRGPIVQGYVGSVARGARFREVRLGRKSGTPGFRRSFRKRFSLLHVWWKCLALFWAGFVHISAETAHGQPFARLLALPPEKCHGSDSGV